MTDRLAALLRHFPIRAQVFHTGTLCGIHALEAQPGFGQLHLIRRGRVSVHHAGEAALQIAQPSLLLYPRPLAHRFVIDGTEGADLACAQLAFEGQTTHPVASQLPPVLCLPLAELPGSEAILDLLFEEANARYCGRDALLDRLFEVLLIQVLRQQMETGQSHIGLLGGLSHPRLRKALVAMHEDPAQAWSLEALARTAGMSRSVFAQAFRQQLGCTPGQYLQRWRIRLAQRALEQGRPLKLVASEVGYGSEAALSRAFKASVGLNPSAWKGRG